MIDLNAPNNTKRPLYDLANLLHRPVESAMQRALFGLRDSNE